MKFGKYSFKNMAEFNSVSNLAIANGVRTLDEFDKFLSLYYIKKII